MKLESQAFTHNSSIPAKYTCDGGNLIPPLTISDVPAGTKSLALIMDDPDIPDFVKKSRGIEIFVHWVIFNMPAVQAGMPPRTIQIEEGIAPAGVQGANSAGENKYTGPCPPDKEHRYFFRIFALGKVLELQAGATKAEVEHAMEGAIIEKTELIGIYNRQQNL
ncbi:MAG: YbhB/YbcL family Raf kinase inhibitor-like protein [Candidatus Colwellbacteria bacterium]|nr:YbhB/YbcL family Raf kinase inhibitor-like protein [Candidatus Colwellbacteria bacterium]